MNPTCKKRLGAIRLETMKVVAQEEIAPAIFELVLEGEWLKQCEQANFFICVCLMTPIFCAVLFRFHLLIRLRSSVISFIGLRELGQLFLNLKSGRYS